MYRSFRAFERFVSVLIPNRKRHLRLTENMTSETMPNMAQQGRFFHNVKWQLVGSISQASLGALLLTITAKQFGVAGYGVMSIVLGYVAVANLLLEPRIQDVAAKEFWNLNQEDSPLVQYKQYIIDLFIVEVLCKFLVCLGLIVLAPMLAKIGNLSSDSALLIIIAATGAFLTKIGSGLSVGILRVLGRLDLHTYCTGGELVFRLIVTLAFINFGTLSVLTYVIVFSVSGIVSNAIIWIFVVKQFDEIASSLKAWEPSAAVQRIRKKRNLILVNIGLSASDLMNRDLDVTLMSPMLSSDQVGLYKMAKNIAMLSWRAVDPFYTAILPELSRLVAIRHYPAIRRLILRIFIGLLILSLFASLVSYTLIVVYGDAILGNAFSNAQKLLPWMFVGVIIGASLIWGHPLVVALNRPDISLKGSLLGSIFGLAVFFNLTNSYGAIGSSIAWSLTLVITFAFTASASCYLLREQERVNCMNNLK